MSATHPAQEYCFRSGVIRCQKPDWLAAKAQRLHYLFAQAEKRQPSFYHQRSIMHAFPQRTGKTRPASALEGRAACKADDDVGDNQDEGGDDGQQARVLPPQALLQPPRLALEGEALVLQVVRLVHQQLYALAAVQHLIGRSASFGMLDQVKEP